MAGEGRRNAACRPRSRRHRLQRRWPRWAGVCRLPRPAALVPDVGGRSGIDLRTLQELAGHSTPLLTARYMHVRLRDVAGAVNKMPNLVPSMPMPIPVEIPLRMTGTDGASGVVPGVVRGDIQPLRNAPLCTLGVFEGNTGEVKEPLEMTEAGAFLPRPASVSIPT